MSASCLIIAGEKSGEEHALSFYRQLKKSYGDLAFFGVGGDLLQKEGMELIYHLNDFSSFGISEVIFKIPFYGQAMNRLVQLVEKRKTNVAILVDFQDFNLRLAKRLKHRGVHVFYYVAPQAWVWRPKRAQVLEETVHTLFTIIPFEKEWFKKRGVSRVHSVDHPLLAHFYSEVKKAQAFKKEKKVETKSLVILPGSRNFEVKSLLPDFMTVALKLKREFGLTISLVKSPSVKKEHYEKYEEDVDRIYWSDQIAEALTNSDLALASSGTVTLTCALFSVPTVVAYKGSLLNEFIYYTFLNYKGHISLANLVHDKRLFPEFTQEFATPFNLERALRTWIDDLAEYKRLCHELDKTVDLLRGTDGAVADYLEKTIKEIYA